MTASVGTLVPAECFEVLPNDTISMGAMAKTTLPPFAVPFMGRVDACLEAFFVPMRLLWKGWQSFITQNTGSQRPGNPMDTSNAYMNPPIQVPVVDLSDSENQAYLGPASLADYLGYKNNGTTTFSISALKFLAYHKVCDHYYRDQNNMKPFFMPNPGGGTLSAGAAGSVSEQKMMSHLIDSVVSPYGQPVSYNAVLNLSPQVTSGSGTFSFDGSIGLGSLRQRCWAKDYFTTATTRPQAGDAAQIVFDTSAANGAITIADIRAANALQKWLERNNLSVDYGTQILSHFGVTPPDAVLDKPLLLGQIREPVYVGSVENNSNAETTSTKNPFGSALGSAAGFGSGFGKGSLIPEFHAKEHGFIIVMYSLVPHAYYNSGIERELRHVAVGDFAWPEYAHIGDQPIYAEELTANAASSVEFGYNQRYSEYKFRQDKISGLLRDGQNLDVYALQRGFASVPALGKEFLEIPTTYLDQVFALDSEVGKFGCIVDCFFDTRAIRLLPEYSLPSL